MKNAFRYAAISSKLSVRKRFFLNSKDYETIIGYDNITQVTDFLSKRVDFKQGFDKVANIDIHRGDLEVMLYRYEVSEIEKMLHYFSGHYKSFLKVLLMEYEIWDLQLILQTIAKGETLEEVRNHFIHSKKYTSLDYEELTNARTVLEFVECLRGSIYYEPLKTITKEDMFSREFHMEMKLHVLYYKELMKKAQRLSDADSKMATDMIGILIDTINVQWMYRGRKYYHISPEEILIYIIPGGIKIPYSRLKKLCYTNTIEEFKEKVQKYLRYPIFEDKNDSTFEMILDKYLYSIYVKQKHGIGIGSMLGYIYELTLQVKELIRITESTRYGYTTDKKMQYLVRMK